MGGSYQDMNADHDRGICAYYGVCAKFVMLELWMVSSATILYVAWANLLLCAPGVGGKGDGLMNCVLSCLVREQGCVTDIRVCLPHILAHGYPSQKTNKKTHLHLTSQ